MGYLIQLDTYEGPFDLLLDLIAQNEIDIWDIPISTITEQYLDYLSSLQEHNLAITGEFLVMAATLIRIKSRLLLPLEPSAEEEQEEEVDPRLELVEQLLRYKFFKDVVVFLQTRYEEAVLLFTKGHSEFDVERVPVFTNPVGGLTTDELAELFYALLAESEKVQPVHAVPTRISVQERLARVRLQLVKESQISFKNLLRDCSPPEVVVTLLAVLELVRLGEIVAVQEQSFGEIFIEVLVPSMEVL